MHRWGSEQPPRLPHHTAVRRTPAGPTDDLVSAQGNKLAKGASTLTPPPPPPVASPALRAACSPTRIFGVAIPSPCTAVGEACLCKFSSCATEDSEGTSSSLDCAWQGCGEAERVGSRCSAAEGVAHHERHAEAEQQRQPVAQCLTAPHGEHCARLLAGFKFGEF